VSKYYITYETDFPEVVWGYGKTIKESLEMVGDIEPLGIGELSTIRCTK